MSVQPRRSIRLQKRSGDCGITNGLHQLTINEGDGYLATDSDDDDWKTEDGDSTEDTTDTDEEYTYTDGEFVGTDDEYAGTDK